MSINEEESEGEDIIPPQLTPTGGHISNIRTFAQYHLRRLTLDEIQKEIARIDENVVVIAKSKPGSGKTRVLIARALFLMTKIQDPTKICLVTFTNNAKSEMEMRFPAQLRKNIEITTFHSLCSKFCRNFFHHKVLLKTKKDLLPRSRSIYKEKIVDDILEKLCLDMDLHSALEILEETRYLVDVERDELESLSRDHRLLYQEYSKYLREESLYDYTSLLITMCEKMSNEQIQLPYTHLLIDEGQDTNKIKFNIVYHFLRHKKRHHSNAAVNVVGDPDQRIYSYSGLSIEFVEQFASKFPNSIVKEMHLNYRCHKNIQAGLNMLFDRPTPGISFNISYDYRLFLMKTDSILSQYSKIMKILAKIPTDNNLSIGILVRRNKEKNHFMKYLKDKKISNLRPRLSTIHSAKGSEFDIVLILNCIEFNIPLIREIDTNEEDDVLGRTLEEKLAEERRVFNVGVSRAKKMVLFCVPRSVQGVKAFYSFTGNPNTSSFVLKMGDYVRNVHNYRSFVQDDMMRIISEQ